MPLQLRSLLPNTCQISPLLHRQQKPDISSREWIGPSLVLTINLSAVAPFNPPQNVLDLNYIIRKGCWNVLRRQDEVASHVKLLPTGELDAGNLHDASNLHDDCPSIYRISRPIRRTFPRKSYLNSACVLCVEGQTPSNRRTRRR